MLWLLCGLTVLTNFGVLGAVCAGSSLVFARENLTVGIQLLEDGHVAAARQLFASAVQERPHDAAAAFYLGRTFFVEAHYDRAAEWFARAAERDANSAEYHLWLGRAYGHQALRAGPWKQVLLARKVKTHFERAVALDPDNTAARLDLLEYYLQAPSFLGGSRDKARAQVEEIKRRDAARGREAEARLAAARGRTRQAKSD